MKTYCVLLLGLLFGGCSKIVYSPVDKATDSVTKGIRYYNSSPYLLVYPNGKGGLKTQLLFIADPFKKMSAMPSATLAKLNTTLDFEKGVYKKGKDELDGTSFPKAIFDAVKTVAPLLLAALNAPIPKGGLPPPHLYKIIILGDKIQFVGGEADTRIEIFATPN